MEDGVRPLQLCEVALRNLIHAELTRLTGRAYWYHSPGFTLSGYANAEIQKLRLKLAKRLKPMTPGQVVSELTFGFWPSLFEEHYERHTPFMPAGIRHVFPHLPKTKHSRKGLKVDLEKIRSLHNRIFHHERILHLKDLDTNHQLILSVISWISPELLNLAQVFDRSLR